MAQNTKASREQKANALLARDGITEDATARVFYVDGGGKYVVVLGARSPLCTCPAYGGCYHIAAAQKMAAGGCGGSPGRIAGGATG